MAGKVHSSVRVREAAEAQSITITKSGSIDTGIAGPIKSEVQRRIQPDIKLIVIVEVCLAVENIQSIAGCGPAATYGTEPLILRL